MPRPAPGIGPDAFTTFGELLHFLRRRARLKQRDLAIASGYSEAQISRLEQNQRLPDPITLAALIIPALGLEREPELAGRLLALANAARAGAEPAAARQGAAPSPAPPPPGPPPLALAAVPVPAPAEVPRHGDLARLRARLAANRHVALCGLAGAGKTTLAAALAREHARSAPVFWLTLAPQTAATIDTLIAHLAHFLQAHRQPVVAPLLEPGEGAAPLPLERQIALICDALARLDTPAPPLICLDNFYLVQYAQPVAQLLAGLMASTAAALLLTSREAVPLPGVTSVVLGGLSDEEARALLGRLGGEPLLAPGLAARLQAKTGGNPMLLRLAVGQLADQGADAAALIARLETTPQIAAYLLEAVQRGLSPGAARLGALLAVLRAPVSLYDEALAELCADDGGFGDLGAAAAELQRRLLIADPVEAALHPLVRDHFYATLAPDPALRRRLHRLAARIATQALADPLQAIFHYARADAHAEATAILAANVDTLHAQGHALAAAKLVDELLARARRAEGGAQQAERLLLARADLLVNTLRTAEAEADYRAALAAAATPATRALAGIRLAQSLAQRGQARQALRACAAARAELAPADDLLLAELAVSEAWAHRALSQHDEVLRVAREALPRAEGLAAAHPHAAGRLRATLHAAIGAALYARRRLEAAGDELRRAVALAEQAGLLRAADRYRGELSHVLIAAGDPAGALRLLDAVVPGVRASGDIFTLELLLSLQMLGRFLRGELAAARELLDGALALRHTLGVFLGPSTAEGHYQTVLIALGRQAEARELLARLLEQIEPGGSQRELGYCLCRRAALELLGGDPAAAQATLRAALELPAAADDPRLRADAETALALALLAGGLPARAARLAADEPAPDAGAWAALERALVRALAAAALGDAPAATAIAAAARSRAGATGHLLYQAAAARVLAAVAAPLQPGALAALIWVHGGG